MRLPRLALLSVVNDVMPRRVGCWEPVPPPHRTLMPARVIILSALLLAVSSPAYAQLVPLSNASQFAWGLSDREDGTALTMADAQRFEARVRVDGSAPVVVLTGVTCATASILDASRAVWTLGDGVTPDIPILRNGMQAAGGRGAQILFVSPTIFVLYPPNWWQWDGANFSSVGATDPGTATDPRIGRWACQAPIPVALVARLAVTGAHSVVLRVYDSTAALESKDSNVAVLIAQPVVPFGIRIGVAP